MEKRLYRSRNDRKLAGVCGGIAEYYGWDPTLVRVAWIVLTLLGGSGILIYLILWLVMPESPSAPHGGSGPDQATSSK